MEAELGELRRQVDAQRHRIGVLTSDLNASRVLIEGLNDELDTKRRQIAHKNHLLDARDSQISRLERRMRELEASELRHREALTGMADLFGCTPVPERGEPDGQTI